jgi:hypothetical protein
MLRITVSLIPGGHGTERQLGELHIINVRGGALADYKCVLSGDDLPKPVLVHLGRYPRWSASVWDLVGRAIAKSLSGQERLPRRPDPVTVPIHADGDITYVRMCEIPEPARSAFERRMRGSTVPVIPGEGDCAYSWDWRDFIGGGRWRW